jgi:hypothetical protein
MLIVPRHGAIAQSGGTSSKNRVWRLYRDCATVLCSKDIRIWLSLFRFMVCPTTLFLFYSPLLFLQASQVEIARHLFHQSSCSVSFVPSLPAWCSLLGSRRLPLTLWPVLVSVIMPTTPRSCGTKLVPTTVFRLVEVSLSILHRLLLVPGPTRAML